MFRLKLSLKPLRALKERFTKDTMTEKYMTQDDEPDPFNETNLNIRETDRTKQVRDVRDRGRRRTLVDNVKKIHRAAKRDPIDNDEQVEDAMSIIYAPQSPEACYYYYAGPLAATVDGLEWNSAFRVDLSETVPVGSDEFKEVASGFEIPTTDRYSNVPSFIKQAYRRMITLTERNNGERAIHQWELEGSSKTPYLQASLYDYGMRRIEELPGVIPPEESKPAWTTETAETDAQADATEEKKDA